MQHVCLILPWPRKTLIHWVPQLFLETALDDLEPRRWKLLVEIPMDPAVNHPAPLKHGDPPVAVGSDTGTCSQGAEQGTRPPSQLAMLATATAVHTLP